MNRNDHLRKTCQYSYILLIDLGLPVLALINTGSGQFALFLYE